MNYFSKRLQSFIPAINGIRLVFKEANFKIHVTVFLMVLILSFLLDVSKIEFIILLIFSCMVFCAEALNTSVEKLGDAITMDHDEHIKIAKDIGAGAVLICSIFAITVGLYIFIPKLLSFI